MFKFDSYVEIIWKELKEVFDNLPEREVCIW